MCGVDAYVLRVTIVLEYTFRVWSGFRQAACAIGNVARAVDFLEDALVMTRLPNSRCSRSLDVIDFRS